MRSLLSFLLPFVGIVTVLLIAVRGAQPRHRSSSIRKRKRTSLRSYRAVDRARRGDPALGLVLAAANSVSPLAGAQHGQNLAPFLVLAILFAFSPSFVGVAIGVFGTITGLMELWSGSDCQEPRATAVRLAAIVVVLLTTLLSGVARPLTAYKHGAGQAARRLLMASTLCGVVLFLLAPGGLSLLGTGSSPATTVVAVTVPLAIALLSRVAPDLVLSLAATAVTLGELVIDRQVGLGCEPAGSRLVAVVAFLLTVSCVRAVRSWKH